MSKAFVQRDTAVTGKYYVEASDDGGGALFIDTSEIDSHTISGATLHTYTAEYDCYVTFQLIGQNNQSYVKIGNAVIVLYEQAGHYVVVQGLYLKAGDTMSIYSASADSTAFNVFKLK